MWSALLSLGLGEVALLVLVGALAAGAFPPPNLLVLSAIALATASSDGADDLVLTEEFPQLLLLVYFDTLDDDGFD